MEYTTLTIQDKITGLNNRISQLEQEYFSNEVFALEAEMIGSTEELAKFELLKQSLETRIDGLRTLVSKLSETTKDTNEDGDTV